MANVIQQQMENKVEKSNKQRTIKDYIKMYESQIARALPNVITPERFSRMVLTAITKTPKLAECTPESFMGAMLTAAQLIPDESKCEFQIGYKGLLELAHRSGELKTLEAHCVYENDEFSVEYGLNPNLIHKPCFKDKGELLGIYAVYHTNNGGYAFEFMSKEDIENHRNQYSKSYKSASSAWQTDFESMAKKTVIKRLLKYAPLKTEFVRAIANDEQTQTIDFTEDNEILILNEDADEENNEIVEGQEVE